jgi:hypothetical protein
MSYKFCTENKNYEDYSSGRVLYNMQGTTSFPVRLASEVFQRCANILREQGLEKPYTLYDSCCGGAYLVTSLGFLHGEVISKIFVSDIDETVITLAEKNLSLLTLSGLKERTEQIQDMFDSFGKTSHKEALESAARLRNIIEKQNSSIEIKSFISDITADSNLKDKVKDINILITDLPYGEIVEWSNQQQEKEAVAKLLDNVYQVLAEKSIIAIISMKKNKIKHDKYKKVDQFNIGKRSITFLQPNRL